MVREIVRQRGELSLRSFNKPGRNDCVRALCLPLKYGPDATAAEWEHCKRLSRAIGDVLRKRDGLEILAAELVIADGEGEAPKPTEDGRERTLLIAPWRMHVRAPGRFTRFISAIGARLDHRFSEHRTLDRPGGPTSRRGERPRATPVRKLGRYMARRDAHFALHERYSEVALRLHTRRSRLPPEEMEDWINDLLAR
jgi:hypothetical protein